MRAIKEEAPIVGCSKRTFVSLFARVEPGVAHREICPALLTLELRG